MFLRTFKLKQSLNAGQTSNADFRKVVKITSVVKCQTSSNQNITQ